MSVVRIAKRYAKSLLELAIEQNSLENIFEDVKLLNKTLTDNRQLYLALTNPVVKHAQKGKILNQLFVNRFNVLTMSFINIICKKGRTSILPFVYKEFENQYNIFKGIENATVITASAIPGELRNDFIRVIQQISNAKEVVLEERLNPDIIGGFILKVGDKQIDDSISGRLKSLRNKLITRSYN